MTGRDNKGQLPGMQMVASCVPTATRKTLAAERCPTSERAQYPTRNSESLLVNCPDQRYKQVLGYRADGIARQDDEWFKPNAMDAPDASTQP